MYKALIIDDETDARGVLRKMLELFCPQIGKTYEASNGKIALEIAKAQRPEIAFVDIKLRKENGLEVAENIKPYCSSLIFVTAYDAYAVAAFRTPAVGYLLKPVDPEQLQEAINRVSQQLEPPIVQTITLPTRRGLIRLEQNTIDYVQGEGNYSTFFCSDGNNYTLSKHLSFCENQLDPQAFVRIHQSYLVRVAAVQQYLVNNGFYAVLQSGLKLPISRRRKDDFLRALQG